MNFSSPEKIASVIENLKTAAQRRAPNRTLVNNLFNGWPPYSKTEVDENHIQWNVNWQEGPDLLLQAREQMENAHLSTDYFFTVKIPDAPPSKRSKIEQACSKRANRVMKDNLPYLHTQREKWGSVILHGVGSQMWEDQWKWRPFFVGIDDLMIPTDTTLPFDDLNHFALRRRMTPGQLFRRTFALPESSRDPGWNLKAVQKILNEYRDVNQNQDHFNWLDHPEKAAEIWKQNSSYYDSDKVPKIWLWDFYYQEDDDAQARWYRKILLDSDCVPGRTATAEDPVVTLYSKDAAFADTLGQIMITQFIDGNNVPPFMYHSVRGLGMRLFDSVHALNRLRNQAMQKTMEDLMLLFRVDDPIDRSRLDQIYLGINYGVVPQGLNFVTRDQRYQIDPNLLQMQLSSLKQLIGEGSMQYTQDIDTGTKKERTAYEVSALLNQTTRLTGSMLNLSYLQEAFAYNEICRRFTNPKTQDFECKKLQNALREDGVPEKWIDSSKWEIEPVRVLGSGNPQLEQGQAMALLNVRPMLNPEAQAEVMHDYIYAMTHDPKRANRLAPIDLAPVTNDTIADTERVFGALMAGSRIRYRPGLIPADVVGTMLDEMEATVSDIMQSGGVGDQKTVIGLDRAAKYASQYLNELAQDKTQQQLVKQFSDRLGKVMNEVKAMAQRQQQAAEAQAQQQNQPDPAMIQKLQMNQMASQQKLASTQQKHDQKMAQTNQKFALDQKRKNLQTVAAIQNKTMQTTADAMQNTTDSMQNTSESE